MHIRPRFRADGPAGRLKAAATISRTQGPAFSMAFKGYVNAGTLRYDGYVGMYLGNLDRDGVMDFRLVFQDGVTSRAKLRQIWTLPKGEPTQSAGLAGGGASIHAALVR